MEEADNELGFFDAAPSLVSLASFSPIPLPSSRRLSSSFSDRTRPVPASRRLAWISLQGRLVNAEEASSSRAIKGCLSPQEAVAWDLFSPIQRFLIVAVIGVAVAESKKNRQICQLKKSVELRDQVLSSMQQKLDCLCEQLNNVKEHPGTVNLSMKNVESLCSEGFGSENTKFVDCGCWICDQHHDLFNSMAGNSVLKASSGHEILQCKIPLSYNAEQEERRMSDLSDLASSVTSAAEIQMNNLAIEQDIYNLRRNCEEKDATINELTTLLHSSDTAGSKRTTELEDIIRRKNMIITRLKKDMAVLEQKVVSLTRLRRRSFPSSDLYSRQLPYMTENLLYDMESTTSPSSSDSDSSPANRAQSPAAKTPHVAAQSFEPGSRRSQKSMPAKVSASIVRTNSQQSKSRPVSPLQEISMNQKFNSVSSSSRQLSAREDSQRSRRHYLPGQKNASTSKRWV